MNQPILEDLQVLYHIFGQNARKIFGKILPRHRSVPLCRVRPDWQNPSVPAAWGQAALLVAATIGAPVVPTGGLAAAPGAPVVPTGGTQPTQPLGTSAPSHSPPTPDPFAQLGPPTWTTRSTHCPLVGGPTWASRSTDCVTSVHRPSQVGSPKVPSRSTEFTLSHGRHLEMTREAIANQLLNSILPHKILIFVLTVQNARNSNINHKPREGPHELHHSTFPPFHDSWGHTLQRLRELRG